MSATSPTKIGQELSKRDREWLFSGRCPDCGGTKFKEGFAQRQTVVGVITTNIRCQNRDCRFSAQMHTTVASKPQVAGGKP
jgi:hypothetical protein